MSAKFDTQSVLAQIVHLCCCTTFISCAFTTNVYTSSPQMMHHVIAGKKLEGVEAMRLQLAFMIEFVSSPVCFLRCALFSYTCDGRNCNKNVTAMFLCAIQRTPHQVIMHNFLESGHSCMVCDSMHSAAEHEKRHADVFTMLDWTQIFCWVRCKNPYKVFNYHHKRFYDFQKLAQRFLTNNFENKLMHFRVIWVC